MRAAVTAPCRAPLMLGLFLLCVMMTAAAMPAPEPAPPTPDMVSDEPLIGQVATRHEIHIGGTRLAYTATFAETPLSDSNGKLQATISSTAYVVDGVRDRARRPVVFLFNGGPGASSSPLHFGAFGPRILAQERDASGQRKLTDNAYTLLDAADLVFIDPVGTGFSRERPGARSGEYWSVEGDAQAALMLMRKWLADNNRGDSPLFVAGESYGGFRLASMLEQADDLPIAGLIFISPLLDVSGSSSAPGNDLPYIFELPSMAVAAWEHHKIDRAGRTIEQVYAEAERFAQSDYAVALQQGSALPIADRDRLAGRIATLIGLPAPMIAAANLRVDSQTFLEKLMDAEGLIVGRLDTRVTAPKQELSQLPNRPAGANDPALGLGASNVIKSPPIKAYLERELGVPTARDYLSLTLDVNFRWNWQGERGPRDEVGEPRFYLNPTQNIAAAMIRRPRMRVLLVGGYYDMTVPLLAPRYALTHVNVPLDRVTMHAFVAPHSAFQGEANLANGSGVVHDFLRVATAAALAPPPAGSMTVAAQEELPSLSVVLKPHSNGGEVDYVDVSMAIEHPNVAAGATLLRMPLVVASIPTARYDGDAIQARDASGTLPLTQQDAPPTSFLSNRDWLPTRATSGDVTLHYHAPPRVVTASTRGGPLFDLRDEAGGVQGAGWTFLAVPVNTEPYRIQLHWDLSDMPAGSRGISSLGESDVSVVAPAERLMSTFYFAGAVHSYPPQPTGNFAMYWLSEPPFDVVASATMIKKLFGYMSKFFNDDGGAYRVFLRKTPVNGGGTALTRSFMFGYGASKPPTVESLEGLIAHEMVHNWPQLSGDHADTSWYTEGTAEYYSVVLSYRAGLITPDEFLKGVNEHASGYYLNSLQNLTNRGADAIYWKDSRAGHVPYGRGFMYLAAVDAQIRARSGHKRSLDDVVLQLLERTRAAERGGGKEPTVADWEALIGKELGSRGTRGYEDMVAGKELTPPANAFGPCFLPMKADLGRPLEPGFDVASLSGPQRMIRGLVAGSAAALAGLRDGDEVLEAPDLGDPGFKDTDKLLVMKIRRAGVESSVTFKPAGKPVSGYLWARNKRVSDADCKI